MCRCLMAIDVVSQHGPNAQGVRSRPDRSVSLPVPDARGVAAEMMGGVGNLTLKRLQKQHDDLISRYERLAPDSPNAPYNQERDELLQAIDEIEEQIRKMDPPPPPPPVEVLDLDDPAARKAALAKWGAPHLGAVPDLPPGTSAMSGVEGVPGGFDFDSFDADLAKAIEGTLESAGPVTAEQSEPWDLGMSLSDQIRVGIEAAAGESPDAIQILGTGDGLDEVYSTVMQEVIAVYGTPLEEEEYGDPVWGAIHNWAERRGWEWDNDNGRFVPEDRTDWIDPLSLESRAVGPLSGLPGFQSPSVSPGSPAFQGMPAPKGPQGFQPAAALPQPGGYQGAPPSVQSMLTAMSGEPPRTGRAHPERPPAPYEPVPEISEEQKKINKEAIEKIRKDHNLMEGLNPESKMDAAFLPEMFSQGTAQGSDGYFGGAGDLMGSIVEAVPGIDPKMAGMVAAAILAAVAAGTGFGGPLVPPILAGGAALASQ